MGSDRARITYDKSRQYRAVVMQQGRVTVEADWNEEWQIANEELRKDVLDIMGPCCTPNDGYNVLETNQASDPPFDFSVSNGTMYVGGMRVFVADPLRYSQQPDWLDHLHDPDWVDLPGLQERHNRYEFVYLSLREQEVSAVEDGALREVALGGPDTAQRLRLIQHIVRLPIGATDCAGALAEAKAKWAARGLHFDEQTMQLTSSGKLQASFVNVVSEPNPCEPQAHGGYLGADNQLIRVQISDFDRETHRYKLVWGFDNASFLYRVTVEDDLKTLKLQSRPVDDFHKPRAGQAVEVLRSAAQLSAVTNDYIASATGIVATLDAPYVSDTQSITLPATVSLPPEYTNASQTPVVFLRVWEEEKSFTPGTSVTLGTTGLQVTLQTTGNEPLHIGDYWLMAVRPDTGVDPNASTQIFPHRYLENPQSPDGPRMWACALAVIEWTSRSTLHVLDDCRNHCDKLVDLTKRNLGGCCNVTVRPEDITESNTLQSILDRYSHQDKITVCLMPGTYTLPKSLLLGPQHSNLTLEGCHDGVVIQAQAGKETEFLQGLIVLNRADNVTLRGLRLELPQAPFNAAGGRIAQLDPTVTRRILGAQLRDLHVSIGVRPLHCALLTIKDCLFRFSVTADADVFAAAIFAGSECWGLTVQGNRFVREEDVLRVRESPLRILFGYLLSPATIFKSGRAGPSTIVAVQAGTLVRSLLQDASFEDNLFTGLTAAAYIYADAGVVKIERNTVRDCYGGFWLQSLRSLAFAAFLDEVSVNKSQLAAAQQLRNAILTAVFDPITQIGSVIARAFPLPKEFDVSQAVQVEEQRVSNTAEAERRQIQTLFDKALSFLPGTEEAPQEKATAKEEKVQVKKGAPPLAETTFTSGTGLGRLNTLHLHLSAFERAAILQGESKVGLRLALHLSDNNIDATVTRMTSGMGVLVWDDERDIIGTMTMSANKMQNQGRPTVFIIMVACCAITGNIILNQELTGEFKPPRSLLVYPGPPIPGGVPNAGAGVAVTGNVFGGTPQLPPRPPFNPPAPPPMDRWEFLNTLIYN